MEDINKFIVERIMTLRNERGVSAYEMSLALGQSKNYISQIENRKSAPPYKILANICDYFEITLSEFFDFENAIPDLTHGINEQLKLMDRETANAFLALAEAYNKNLKK